MVKNLRSKYILALFLSFLLISLGCSSRINKHDCVWSYQYKDDCGRFSNITLKKNGDSVLVAYRYAVTSPSCYDTFHLFNGKYINTYKIERNSIDTSFGYLYKYTINLVDRAKGSYDYTRTISTPDNFKYNISLYCDVSEFHLFDDYSSDYYLIVQDKQNKIIKQFFIDFNVDELNDILPISDSYLAISLSKSKNYMNVKYYIFFINVDDIFTSK